MHDGFLFYALIFLLAAVIVVPLVKRSGLGAVLGYLVAGVLIGPFGLKLITNNEDIMHFAEFGVVMMLFLIGLELEPRTLWRLRKPVLGLGSSQVILTTGIISLVGHFCGLDWPIAATIGMAVSLSSTAIAIQLMNERNLMPTYTGQQAFSVLLFQDLAVIPILALIPILADSANVRSMTDALAVVQQQAGGSVWEKTLTVIGLVTFLALLGHYGIRRLLAFIARSGIGEIFTATALLLVVGVSFLMQSVGLSPALGALIAGVILAESEYRHEIETQIEPFKSLLLGLFFMSVGMSIDFAVFHDHMFAIIGAVAGLIAIKFIVLATMGKVFKLDLGQNLLFSILLAQGGEFGFVISQFAFQQNLLSEDMMSMINVVVALSMMITPLLILFYDRKLARKFMSFMPVNLEEMQPRSIEHSDVVIVGYGRFGQIIGRLLQANGIRKTILDHDPKQIDFLRRFGWKVYYGDVADMRLLRAAGAEKARLVVLAVDERGKAVDAARKIKSEFPHIKIMARAFDRRHAYDLTKAGVDYFERETFEAALHMGEEVLKELGYNAAAAKRLARKFSQHDRDTLRDSFQHFEDEKAMISHSLQSREELIKIFESDRGEVQNSVDMTAALHPDEGKLL